MFTTLASEDDELWWARRCHQCIVLSPVYITSFQIYFLPIMNLPLWARFARFILDELLRINSNQPVKIPVAARIDIAVNRHAGNTATTIYFAFFYVVFDSLIWDIRRFEKVCGRIIYFYVSPRLEDDVSVCIVQHSYFTFTYIFISMVLLVGSEYYTRFIYDYWVFTNHVWLRKLEQS